MMKDNLDETMKLICEVAIQEVCHYLDEPTEISKSMAHLVGVFIMKNKDQIVESSMIKLDRCKSQVGTK